MGIQEINSNHIKSHLQVNSEGLTIVINLEIVSARIMELSTLSLIQKYRQTRDHIQRIETEAAMKGNFLLNSSQNN